MSEELPYGEDVPYWKTGRTDPSTIIAGVVSMIEDYGGTVTQELQGRVGSRAGFLIEFFLEGDDYRVAWPVLESKKGAGTERIAAMRQAATFIKHDVKAKLLSASVIGVKAAFSPYLITEQGVTVMEHLSQGISDVPRLTGDTRQSEIYK